MPTTPVSEDTQPTSADDWRGPRTLGQILELPSGKKARVKRVMDLVERVKNNTLPNPLAGIVQETIARRDPTVLSLDNLDKEVLPQMLDYMDETVVKMMIEPRVEVAPEDAPWDWEPSEGAIALDDVDLQDRMFLFNFAQGGTAELSRFREIAQIAMEDVQDVRRPVAKTKRTGGGRSKK